MTKSESKQTLKIIMYSILLLSYLIISCNLLYYKDVNHMGLLVWAGIVYTVYDIFGYKKWHEYIYIIIMVYTAYRTIEYSIYGV